MFGFYYDSMAEMQAEDVGRQDASGCWDLAVYQAIGDLLGLVHHSHTAIQAYKAAYPQLFAEALEAYWETILDA